MSQAPKPNKAIKNLKPYNPGKSPATKGSKVFKLSANETPLGPSKKAIKAFSEVAGGLQDYPDGGATKLRNAIAKNQKINPDNVICGCGSDELISLICRAYLEPNDEAIYSQYGFLMYKISIIAAGGKPVVAKEKELRTDVDQILKCVTKKTKIVFIANPNNPTGTYISSNEIKKLRKSLDKKILLVIDAAYAEYVNRNDYQTGNELVTKNNNVVVTRTFSKIHGLAALRIGWMYAPKNVVDTINRIRLPFNVNSAAAAAATAAINDKMTTQKAIQHNQKWIAWTTEEIKKLGLKVTPSVANFILIHFGKGQKNAEMADKFLTKNGFVLRDLKPYGLKNALRMTIGTKEANQGVVKALKKFVK